MSVTVNGDTGVSKVQDGVIVQADLASGVAGTGPAFSAYQSSAQTISSATFTKVNFQTEEFDTNNCFSSSRFTPNIAGYYQINGGIFSGLTAGLTVFELRKNGTTWKRLSGSPTPAQATPDFGSALVYLNGTTDYVELYFYQSSGSSFTVPFASSDLVYFQGALVRAA